MCSLLVGVLFVGGYGGNFVLNVWGGSGFGYSSRFPWVLFFSLGIVWAWVVSEGGSVALACLFDLSYFCRVISCLNYFMRVRLVSNAYTYGKGY